MSQSAPLHSLPEPAPIRYWQDALADGRILLQRSADDGSYVFPPRIFNADGSGFDWVEARGTGTVYSVTTVHQRPPAPAYNVVLVDLDEDVRLMGRVEEIAAQDIIIGMAVKAFIAEEDGAHVILFRPATS